MAIKEINIFDDYNINALCSKEDVIAFIQRLKDGGVSCLTENEIVVDFDGCVADYDATALLIDYLLDELRSHVGHEANKTLTVKMNGSSKKEFIYNKLFLGSSIFGLIDKIGDGEMDEWDDRISNSLSEIGITMRIMHNKLNNPIILPQR